MGPRQTIRPTATKPYTESLHAHSMSPLATQADVDVVNTALSANISILDTRVTTLDGQVNTLEGQVVTLDGQVVTLDGQVATLDTRVTTLDEQVATLDGQVATLSTDKVAVNGGTFILPIADPLVAGAIWNNADVLTISAG